MISPEVSRRLRELLSTGHRLVPWDRSEYGMRGVKALLDSEGVEILVEWPLFDGPLRPDKVRVSPEELLDFMRGGLGVICDEPGQHLLGFVRYLPEKSIAVIRQTTAKQLREASSEVRDSIADLRTKLLEGRDQVSIYEEIEP